MISFEIIEEEKSLNGMRADILAKKSETPLIIEVFYRHKVELQKIDKIQRANISAIEINLSDLTPEDVKDMETFWLCINDTKRIQWLHNAKAQDIVYPELINRLEIKIQKQEIEYEQEKIRAQDREQKEKIQLNRALEELQILCSTGHIEKINQEVEKLPAWILHSRYLSISSLEDLPYFLNLEVPNGDWIFGCDRRVWQTAFYSSFICKNGKVFNLKRAEEWLNTKAMCKSPLCVRIVGIYGRRYPELIPINLAGNLPSTWKTLHRYFKELCELGILEFSPNEGSWNSKDSWFKILRKTPRATHSI